MGSNSAARTGGRLDTLDALRGVAALIVVIAHCCMTIPRFSDYGLHYRQAPFDWSDPVGVLLIDTPLRVLWLGRGPVALFFVLSGFVLSLPWLRGRPQAYGVYAGRRFCRIYLPYIAATGVAVLCAAVLAPLRPIGQSEWFDTTNWTERFGWEAAVSHVLMLGTHNVFNNVSWTLVHEMRISLVFPLLLPVLRWRLAGALGMMAALAAISMTLTRLAVQVSDGADVLREVAGSAQYAVLFVMGAATAQHMAWLSAHRLGRFLPLLAGLLLLSVAWPILPVYFQGLGGVCVLVASLTSAPVIGFLRHRALAELGRISYSLYLIHLPVLLSAFCLLHDVVPDAGIRLLVPPVALAAAWGFNRIVEMPAMALGRKVFFSEEQEQKTFVI